MVDRGRIELGIVSAVLGSSARVADMLGTVSPPLDVADSAKTLIVNIETGEVAYTMPKPGDRVAYALYARTGGGIVLARIGG